jgi:pyrrolysyl-tRNA synthetase-like protein
VDVGDAIAVGAVVGLGEAEGVAVTVTVVFGVGDEPPPEPPQAASKAVAKTTARRPTSSHADSAWVMREGVHRFMAHLGSSSAGLSLSPLWAPVPAGNGTLLALMPTDPTKARYYRKQIPLFRLVEKLKLWPSRRGILHGIKEFDERGSYAVVITHCNKHMVVHDSKTSRAARWLRNKWYAEACPQCRIPEWKLQKYAATHFKRGYGSHLRD